MANIMERRTQLWLVAAVVGLFSFSSANAGIRIYAAETGIGKFHRYDNKVHAYGDQNVWSKYIVPEMDNIPESLVGRNPDGTYTVFYSSLDSLLTEIENLSHNLGQTIDSISINAHGLPGAMWFPKDREERDSSECRDWVEAAAGEDAANYKQYYSAIPKIEILQIRKFSKSTVYRNPACTVGTEKWKEILARHPDFRSKLSVDAVVHMASCVVGLGKRGEIFTRELAELLFEGNAGRVETAMNFGLGDWSMPEGMGFWDYLNDAQLKHDNSVYPKNRSDREIMQKGGVRVAYRGDDGKYTTGFINEIDLMTLEGPTAGDVVPGYSRSSEENENENESESETAAALTSIVIPGTNVRASVQ